MKLRYLLTTLVGFFISTASASSDDFNGIFDEEGGHIDRICTLADEFEDRYYRSQAIKEKKRLKAIEDKALIAAIEAEKTRKKRRSKVR
ncbi:MAG: hypothetical protein Q8Q56_01610 [Alphaproteobacteria bacterium]|nr:hypothetical protein [Alphaproteobacteria bacterium]